VAAVRKGHDLLLKADLSIERVHFVCGLHPAHAIGYRALARPLSDIAAMGGKPQLALISVAIARPPDFAWIKDVFAGIFDLAGRNKVSIVGGDTSLMPPGAPTVIDAVVTGEIAAGKELRRSGAKVGDQIYVSGRLGLSALGLLLLRRGKAGKRLSVPAIRSHLYPQPRLDLGAWLARHQLASSAMDISDGLSTDLARLCAASGVGARLEAERIPVPKLPAGLRANALDLALNGGEDYELLFTVPPARVARLSHSYRTLPLHRIGEITRSRELTLVERGKERLISPSGWDPFAAAK
jgi:thiamine-monophosphate kinase